MLQWQRRTGQSATPGTGASTDHTLYDSAGHYLFINSSQTVNEGERAELMSKVFKPGIYFKLILESSNTYNTNGLMTTIFQDLVKIMNVR